MLPQGQIAECIARRPTGRQLAKLTPRGFEVLRLVNKQIAAELGIKLRKMKTHRARVIQKIGVVSVAELVRLAQKASVVPALTLSQRLLVVGLQVAYV
jgi:FixJ family two-component response regulator